MEYTPIPLSGPAQDAPVDKSVPFPEATDDSDSHPMGPSSNVVPPAAAPKATSKQYLHWAWETIALIDAVLALVAIVVILKCHDGQPLPNWPLGISVNTVLSILSTVFKLSCLFIVASCIGQLQWCWFSGRTRQLLDWIRYDEATRGPWGAALLVWSQKGRQPMVVLAAIVLIAAVIVEPFVQELAKLEDCSVDAGNYISSIGVTSHLGGPAPFNNHTILYALATAPQIVSDIQTFVNQGVYDSYDPSSALACMTGNCTFGPFSTIAYCSSCEDISSSIQVTRIGGDSISTILGGGASMNFSNAEWENEGKSVMATMSPLGPTSNLSLAYSAQYLAGETVFTRKGLTYYSRPNINCLEPEKHMSWACGGYGAARCTLGPCVRESIVNVTLGVVTEEILSVSDVFQDWTSSPSNQDTDSNNSNSNSTATTLWGLLDTQCLNSKEKYQLLYSSSFFSSTSSSSLDSQIQQRYTARFNAIIQSDPFLKAELQSRKCFYTIEDPAMVTQFLPRGWRAQLLGDLTMGNYLSHHRGKEDEEADGYPHYLTYQSRPSSSSHSNPPHLAHLYNEGYCNFVTIEALFRRLAVSLTGYMRLGAPSMEPGYNTGINWVTGKTWHYATCLKVRWEWVVFPVAVVFLTGVLLAVVVVVTVRKGLPAWKFSPVVWLLRGPGGRDGLFDRGEEEKQEEEEVEAEEIRGEEGIGGRIETWLSRASSFSKAKKRDGGEETMEGMRNRARGLTVVLRDDGGGAWIERVG